MTWSCVWGESLLNEQEYAFEMQRDVSNWIEDAREKLSEAQKICNEANRYITSTAQRLTLRDDKIPKLVYCLDATRQQLRLLGIIKDSLNMSLGEIIEDKATGFLFEPNNMDSFVSALSKCLNEARIRVAGRLRVHGIVLAVHEHAHARLLVRARTGDRA